MAGEIERLISNLENMDGPGQDVDEARAEISALREELHTRGVTIDHLSAENARMREAVLRMIDCIRCDPTMDGSIRPMGLRSRALVVESIDFACAALGGRDD